MLKNNLKLAIRNLLKQRGYALLNIAGLALGLACCLFIGLWTRDELSFDGFHKNLDRIRRFQADINFGGTEQHIASAPDPLAAAVVAEYPQVEAACRVVGRGRMPVRSGGDSFYEDRVLFADPSLFQVFTFPLVAGDAKTALAEPNTVVISQKMARKYFPSRDPIGQPLDLNNHRWTARVTGVMADIPSNSQIPADFFVSMKSLPAASEGNWLAFNWNTYLLFRDRAAGEQFEAEWPRFTHRHLAPLVEKVLGTSFEEFEKAGNSLVWSSIPMADVHLHAGLRTGDLAPNGSIDTLRAMVVLGLFILLLAVFNFMNLSTARATGRAREVGVRKAMGSQKGQLVAQFLNESVVMAALAAVPAVLVVRLLLPTFNRLAGKEIGRDFWQKPEVLGATVAFVLLTGLLAGIYPAFAMSSFKPIKALKSESVTGRSGAWLRSGLVTAQFAISIALAIGALVTWRQMTFIRNKNLGFDRSQVLVLKNTATLGEALDVLKTEALRLPGVEAASATSFVPTNGDHSDQAYFRERSFTSENGLSMNDWWIDADFLKTMKIGLAAGRGFDPISPADSNALLVNRAAAKMLGWADPVGRELYTLDDVKTQTVATYRIVGMVEDFNFESLKNEIRPLILHRGGHANLAIRLKTADLAGEIEQIRAVWAKGAGGLPFDYEFMDDQFDQLYRSERRAGSLALLFAGLAIAIACLGLFGLAAFTAERRTKEIGVRKVLGASVAQVVGLLSRDFLRLVVAAIFIASPVAYFFMKKWLADFAYRIEIGWWVFAVAGLGAVGIAFLTVSFQSVKAAMADPVKSLRSQ